MGSRPKSKVFSRSGGLSDQLNGGINDETQGTQTLSRHFKLPFEVFQHAKTIFGRFSRRLRPPAAIRNDYDSAEGGRQKAHGRSSGSGLSFAAWSGLGYAATGEPRRICLTPTRYRLGWGGARWPARFAGMIQLTTTDEHRWTRILRRDLAIGGRGQSQPFGGAPVAKCGSLFIRVNPCPSVVRELFRLNRSGCGSSLAPLALAAACLLGSCATKEPAETAPRPGSGVAEYRELTREAVTAVRASLVALDKVSVASNPCPPKLAAAYATEVQRLHADSLRIRARGQAIQARGDAYFADWSASIARIQDRQVRERAERFQPELHQAFSRIKQASQQAGAAFKPFMSGLRMLRVQLDKPPPPGADDATKDLIRTTREHGGEVLHALSGINTELDNITRLLTPGKTVAKQ